MIITRMNNPEKSASVIVRERLMSEEMTVKNVIDNAGRITDTSM